MLYANERVREAISYVITENMILGNGNHLIAELNQLDERQLEHCACLLSQYTACLWAECGWHSTLKSGLKNHGYSEDLALAIANHRDAIAKHLESAGVEKS